MAEPAFTKGPWQAFRDSDVGRWLIDTAPGVESTNQYVIADDIIGPDAEANARLIAAAPELYTAVVELLMTDDGDLPDSHAKAVGYAKAALAKARGESA